MAMVLETCSIHSSSFPCRRKSVGTPGLRVLSEKAEQRIRCFARAPLPVSASTGCWEELSIPPACSPPHQPPGPVLSLPQTKARAKEAWPGLQLGLVSCRKDSSISHLTTAEVDKIQNVGIKLLEQGPQTPHLQEDKCPATQGVTSKRRLRIRFCARCSLGQNALPLACIMCI